MTTIAMYPKTLALAMAPLVLVAQAGVGFDMDDVPNSCKTICGPMGQLSDRCDTDLRSDNDRDEHLLEAQCVCTNRSFDVAKIAALCADCMHQSANGSKRRDDDDNRADRDDLKDIDNLMSTCGFTSTKYNPSATGEVQGITVAATAATDVSQLTTTLTGGSQPAQASATGGTGTAAPATTKTTTMTSGSSTITSTVTSGGTQASGAASSSTTNAAAATRVPGVAYVAGAIVAGGLML
ncbi:CAP22 protein [Purpureocillium lavendulum]|uniref:CAP22 protein n=1 Tax=Purpureocillium lavendulum TaxID=1247861 RepID=A0AB34G8U3_9HYPO|nr:CAP22 protein [Purpureocillium lavendulum]